MAALTVLHIFWCLSIRFACPPGACSFLCYGLAFGCAEGLCSCLTTFFAAHLAQGDRVGVAVIFWCFEGSSVNVLADGLFYDFASDLHKIPLLA
jgi:hypothetical protein